MEKSNLMIVNVLGGVAQPAAAGAGRRRVMATPHPEQCCFFYSHKSGDHKYMSNFYKCRFSMTHECIGKPGEVYLYPTAEHAIMHLKACLMGDEEVADKILSADEPMMAKKLGRKVKPWEQEKWNRHIETIAYSVLVAKFTKNEVLGRKLRDTKDKILAEASPRDKIWGIGIGAAQAKKGEKWNGNNILGKALMNVRAEL